MWPTSAEANPTIRSVMPDRPMISPARMKNGMAMSGNESMPAKVFVIMIFMERDGVSAITNSEERPMPKATGIPAARQTAKLRNRVAIIRPTSGGCVPDGGGPGIAAGSATPPR